MRRRTTAKLSREAFSERLRTVMSAQNVSVAELARRAQRYLPDGDTISVSSISQYRHGHAVPRFRHLEALSLALGIERSELLHGAKPAPEAPRPVEAVAGQVLLVEGRGERVRLKVDQEVPWTTALKILHVLKTHAAD
jgi:transcriptional regulator with XRE-family HTH domain